VGAFKVTRRLRHRVYRSTTLAGSDENQRFQEEAAAQARVCRKAGEHWRQLASIPSSLVSPDDPNPGNPTKPGCFTDSCSEPVFLIWAIASITLPLPVPPASPQMT